MVLEFEGLILFHLLQMKYFTQRFFDIVQKYMRILEIILPTDKKTNYKLWKNNGLHKNKNSKLFVHNFQIKINYILGCLSILRVFKKKNYF